jgi:hypothetical protein
MVPAMDAHTVMVSMVNASNDPRGWRRGGRAGWVGALALIGCVLGGCAGQGPASTRGGSSAATSAGAPGSSTATAPVATATRSPGWRLPPANAVFDYQIGGAYPPATAVGIVDRDRTAAPAPGRYAICYVNAFQTQPADDPWWQTHHDGLLLKDPHKHYMQDQDWPGERLLDISTPARRADLSAIIGGWFADCAARGFQAVEPDNLDSWTRSGGLLSEADAVAFARLLVQTAHAHGLAIGQKNTPQLSQIGRADIGFDFALTEECAVYHECDRYVTAYGDQVYEIEYTDNGTDAYHHACADHGARISIILRDRGVVPAGSLGFHNEYC